MNFELSTQAAMIEALRIMASIHTRGASTPAELTALDVAAKALIASRRQPSAAADSSAPSEQCSRVEGCDCDDCWYARNIERDRISWNELRALR